MGYAVGVIGVEMVVVCSVDECHIHVAYRRRRPLVVSTWGHLGLCNVVYIHGFIHSGTLIEYRSVKPNCCVEKKI